MRTLVVVGAGLFLGLTAHFVSNIVPASGVLLDLKPLLVDRCTRVEVFPGTEDVTIDPDTGFAFVSASDRRAARAGRPVRGGVFTVELTAGHAVANVTPAEPADFQPHGISLWKGPDGDKRLFVINHPAAGGHAVEIFGVGEGGTLAHLETVAFEAMHSPNDVVAIGPRQFYATNDHGFREGVLGMLEAWLALPFASAVYFDGSEGRVVQRGLVYANGINLSADGSTVYIAEVLERRIGFYARDAKTGDLRHLRSEAVATNPDNIEVARDGALWIGGHPRIFDFLAHSKDPAAIAPSQVLRLDPATGQTTTVFLDTGGRLNASSVGAMWNGPLVVGAVFDGHVLVCPYSAGTP
jgi:arylesterase/paraoxonase